MKKVVVIDDDKVTLRLVEKTLVDEGFEVLTAPDGLSGLDLIPQKPTVPCYQRCAHS